MKIRPTFFRCLVSLGALVPSSSHALTAKEQADAFVQRGIAAEESGALAAARNCYELALRANAGNRGAQDRVAGMQKRAIEAAAKSWDLILPKVEFREATLPEVLDFLQRKLTELSPNGVGPNLLSPAEWNGSRVTVSLSNIPAREVVKYVCNLMKCDFEIDGATLVVQPQQNMPAAPHEPVPAAGGNANTADANAAAGKAAALKKYPELGKAGSAFNQEFGLRVDRLKKRAPELLHDPAWVHHIADEVALFSQLKSLQIPKVNLASATPEEGFTFIQKSIAEVSAGKLAVKFLIQDPESFLRYARIRMTGGPLACDALVEGLGKVLGTAWSVDGTTLTVIPKVSFSEIQAPPPAKARVPNPPSQGTSPAPQLPQGIASITASLSRPNPKMDATGEAELPAVISTGPRFSWQQRRSGLEWLEYRFTEPRVVEGWTISWIEDNNAKPPDFWKVLYLDQSGVWLPVDQAPPPIVANAYNTCRFTPVLTVGLRLMAQNTDDAAAGIQKSKVLFSTKTQVPPPQPRAELGLDELIPTKATVGYGSYRVNRVGADLRKNGVEVTIEGKTCDRFLFAHAKSSVTFVVPEGFTRFSAIGIAPGGRKNNYASWTYQLLANDTSVFKSPSLEKAPEGKLVIDVPLPSGTKTITLQTDDEGERTADQSIWAYPKLLRGK